MKKSILGILLALVCVVCLNGCEFAKERETCVSYFFDLDRHTGARDPGRRRHTDKVWNDEIESPWRPAVSAAGAF